MIRNTGQNKTAFPLAGKIMTTCGKRRQIESKEEEQLQLEVKQDDSEGQKDDKDGHFFY